MQGKDELSIKTLNEIIYYCDRVESILSNRFDNNFKRFDNEIDMRDTVIYNFKQIGKFVENLSIIVISKSDNINWEQLIKDCVFMRTKYDYINTKKLWKIVTTEVPELKKTCLELIDYLNNREA